MYQSGSMVLKELFWQDYEAPKDLTRETFTRCENGKAGIYDCDGVDLLSFIPLDDLRPARLRNRNRNSNDIWGWTDPLTNKQWAIICLVDGTSFVDVSDPINPVVYAFMEDTNARTASWRDAKVFKDHVFIGSETADHGLQIWDLKNLRDITPGSDVYEIPLDNAAGYRLYDEFGSSHNIVLNEESGFVYAVGSRTCRGGLHIVDVNEPYRPEFSGCYSEDGYTHDSECVTYKGPDAKYRGREICFNYNEDTLTIVDVTNKNDLVQISREPYNLSQYTHQGWLTADGKHLLMNDELDELEATRSGGEAAGYRKNTRTMVWNVEDLSEPKLVSSFYSSEESIDHNLYIRNDVGYLSNYSAGLRIMNTTMTADDQTVSQLGYFDMCPTSDEVEFLGTWSNFPFYEREGLVAVSSIERGLYMLQVQPQLLV